MSIPIGNVSHFTCSPWWYLLLYYIYRWFDLVLSELYNNKYKPIEMWFEWILWQYNQKVHSWTILVLFVSTVPMSLTAQTLAEVLSEDTDDRRSSPAKTVPPNKTPQPPKTSKSPIAAPPPISSQGTPPNSHMGPMPHQAPSTSGESQFMQQQSQIFVFSTQMANDAAETVMAGQYKNILSFHMDQPNTKKFLQVCTAIHIQLFIVIFFWMIGL